MRTEPHEVSAMRKQAKEIKKITGIKHCQALLEVAKAHGYKNWKAVLMKYEI